MPYSSCKWQIETHKCIMVVVCPWRHHCTAYITINIKMYVLWCLAIRLNKYANVLIRVLAQWVALHMCWIYSQNGFVPANKVDNRTTYNVMYMDVRAFLKCIYLIYIRISNLVCVLITNLNKLTNINIVKRFNYHEMFYIMES